MNHLVRKGLEIAMKQPKNKSHGREGNANSPSSHLDVFFSLKRKIKLAKPIIHPKRSLRKGNPLISGKSRLVKYHSIWPDPIQRCTATKTNQPLEVDPRGERTLGVLTKMAP